MESNKHIEAAFGDETTVKLGLLNENGSVNIKGEPLVQESHVAKVVIEADVPKQSVWWHKFRPLLGTLSVLISSLTFVISMAIVKVVDFVDPFSLAAYRFALYALFSLPLILYRGDPVAPKGFRSKLALRCLVGSSAILLNFYAVQHVPLGEVNMVFAGTPALTVVLAFFTLKEPIALHDFGNILLVVAGVLFISQPPFLFGSSDKYGSISYIIALACLILSTLLQSFVFVLVRMLRELHFSTMLLWFGTLGFVVGMASAFALESIKFPQSLTEFGIILVLGVLGFASQVLMIWALKLENAAIAALLKKTFDIFLAFLVQFMVFQEFPNVFGLLGIGLIMIVVINSGLYKVMQVLPLTSPARKLLSRIFCTKMPGKLDKKEVERKRQHSIALSENEMTTL